MKNIVIAALIAMTATSAQAERSEFIGILDHPELTACEQLHITVGELFIRFPEGRARYKAIKREAPDEHIAIAIQAADSFFAANILDVRSAISADVKLDDQRDVIRAIAAENCAK